MYADSTLSILIVLIEIRYKNKLTMYVHWTLYEPK